VTKPPFYAASGSGALKENSIKSHSRAA